MSEKIAATIVTYNRLTILKKVIGGVREQSRKPDEIVVVDNSSTDGTKEWLAEQNDLTVITQENTGSSGGQWTLFKYAYEKGFDWLWTMDDDVIPRKECLANLLNEKYGKYLIRSPFLYGCDGKPHLHIALSYNLTNPFKSFWKKIISESDIQTNNLEAVGITFEGPLIHRKVIEKIGFPNKKFFIYADDTEYFLRAFKQNFIGTVIFYANFDRQLPMPIKDIKFGWKHYYIIRNTIALDVLYGNLAVRIIRPIEIFILWLGRSRSFSDIKTTLKAFIDGYFFNN